MAKADKPASQFNTCSRESEGRAAMTLGCHPDHVDPSGLAQYDPHKNPIIKRQVGGVGRAPRPRADGSALRQSGPSERVRVTMARQMAPARQMEEGRRRCRAAGAGRIALLGLVRRSGDLVGLTGAGPPRP